MSSANVISMSQYAKIGVPSTRGQVASPAAAQVISLASQAPAYAHASYSEDGPEDIQFVPGSERRPAHLSHVFHQADQLPMRGATPLGDAALEGIYRLLSGRKTKAAPARSMADVWREQAK
jgi:hypothetical protein